MVTPTYHRIEVRHGVDRDHDDEEEDEEQRFDQINIEEERCDN